MSAIRIGDQGDRVVVSAVVRGLERFDTDFGHGTLIKLRTPEGANVYWRSSHGEYFYDLRVGDAITVRATIDRYVQHEGELWCRITNGRLDVNALALV